MSKSLAVDARNPECVIVAGSRNDVVCSVSGPHGVETAERFAYAKLFASAPTLQAQLAEAVALLRNIAERALGASLETEDAEYAHYSFTCIRDDANAFLTRIGGAK